MKTLRLIRQSAAALIIAAVALAGCEYIPGITIDDAALTQTAYADQTAIAGGVTFTTADAWTATVADGAEKANGVTWLTIDPLSGGAGANTINITLEPNTSGEDRSATITVTSGGKSISIAVTQKAAKEDESAPVSGVMLSETALTLFAGQKDTLYATIVPDGAADKTVEWTSNDEKVATVSDAGVVTAVAEGTATIAVTTGDGGFKAGCTVTVRKADDPEKTMTMTAAIEGEATIMLAGAGEAVIDWGDGSAPETVTLSALHNGGFVSSHQYVHTFSGATSRTIVIDGQNITHLNCRRMELTALDVTKNTALIALGCYDNRLTSLDVSHNTGLTELGCDINQLTSLDVTKNTALIALSCHSNQLTSLDVSKNTALIALSCGGNQLASLDVTKNTALARLGCGGNQLASLDVSKNTALTDLDCGGNQLASLDVSKNTALIFLNCYNNQLTSLDVSKNTALRNLICFSNQLTSLDVSKNTALIILSCYNNQLTSLDISNLTALRRFECYDNRLTSLNVSNCTALGALYCNDNRLTAEGLNILFGTLHSNAGNKTIYIAHNPGSNTCDQSIATGKGWRVDTTAP